MAANQQTKTGKSFIPFLIVLYAGAFVGGFNENLLNMALVSIAARAPCKRDRHETRRHHSRRLDA